MNLPIRLRPTPYEKVWGTPLTQPWLRNPLNRKIGEIWFEASKEWPLLVKLLFTSEKLSVQVHPDDNYARAHGEPRGKTEMWHVLRAEPGAQVAVGLREPLTADQLREASISGEIEHLLNWVSARVGDTFFIPAGTVHAVGAGLVLCEVQQFSDVTYRLYDYGRPRPLHLDDAIAVSITVANPPLTQPSGPVLANCQYFQTERLSVSGAATIDARPKTTLCVAVEGEGRIAGQPFQAGEAFEVPPGGDPFEIESPHAIFVIAS